VIVLAGGDLVLPDCILARGSLAFEGPRIAAIVPEGWDVPLASTVVDVAGCYVVPGFVDVHVHGVDGYDTQDEGQPIAAIASRLPRYGVTAFAPTTVACAPDDSAEKPRRQNPLHPCRPVVFFLPCRAIPLTSSRQNSFFSMVLFVVRSDSRVPRNDRPPTPSGPEGSSGNGSGVCRGGAWLSLVATIAILRSCLPHPCTAES